MWAVSLRWPSESKAPAPVIAVGHGVAKFVPGQDVFTHLVPLRDQGTWAERLIAPCGLIALKPGGTSWEVAGAFAVPALTAEQVLSEALGVVDGDVLVVHGAGGVTGGMLVTLGALKGARVIATTAPKSVDRVRWLGASDVLDYDDPDWPDKVRRLTESRGARVAANAAKGGSFAVGDSRPLPQTRRKLSATSRSATSTCGPTGASLPSSPSCLARVGWVCTWLGHAR